jgi:transposase, IS5 family
MRHADQALEDEVLLRILQQELAKRCKRSKTRGRPGTPAEVILRMLLLKHFRDWSFENLTREVRANLVYREFTRIGGGKVPDDKTMAAKLSRFSAMGRLARQLGPEVVEKVHQRIVEIALEKKVAPGRKLRVDTTVVETNIHYPTDSSLLGDGVRVLTRVMKRVKAVAGPVGTKLRDRTRSVRLGVLAMARASRNKTESGKKKLKQAYVGLLEATSRAVGQAKKFSKEIAAGIKRGNRKLLRKTTRQLEELIPRVQQVMRQARQRVLHGNTRAEGKLVSVFEPETEVIRKGKAKKPNEFGKLVKIQEVENQLITHYEVLEKRPADATLLIPSFAAPHSAVWLRAAGGCGRSWILLRRERSGCRGTRGQTRFHPCQREPRQTAQRETEEALVQKAPEVADRVRRPYQYPQAPAWVTAVPLQRALRHEKVGWPRRDCR